MITSFKDTKYYFENLLSTEWSDTPIHFVGQEFDQDNTEKWINPFYSPSYGEHNGLSDTTMNYGNLHIACWAETDVEAMELADDIMTFMNEHVGIAYRIKRFEISDHGWHKTNKVYATISFSLEILEGIC